MKVGTHNADNCVGPAVQQYRLAYNVGITVETALPQLVAEYDDEILPFFLFQITPYEHETLRIFEGQRLQQNSINHAEHGGVRPDAKRERDHGNRGKHRILTQYSCAVT